MIYQRLAKVFLICSDVLVVPAEARRRPGPRRFETAPSHRRQQLVAAIIGVEFSAALPLDRRTSCRGRSVRGHAERTAQAVGAAAGLAGGERRAGGGDAEYQ